MSHHDPFAPRAAAGAVDKDPDGNGRDDHLDSLRKPELVNLATTLGLDKDGNRPDLIARIRAAQRNQKTTPEPSASEPEQPQLDGS